MKKFISTIVVAVLLMGLGLVMNVSAGDCDEGICCDSSCITSVWCSAWGSGAECNANYETSTVTCSGGGETGSWTCPQMN